jgi:hypothetical protein
LVAFGVTAYGGAELVAVQGLTDRVRAGSTDESRLLKPLVSSWEDVTGVATRARSLSLDLVLAETPDDNAAIENALNEMAETSPTSTATWLALAEVRLARNEPKERMLAAFRMSALTGSHEGFFMMRRAVFGLEHWTDLPDGDRRIVVRDLLATVEPAYRFEVRYRGLLAAKSEAERDDIRAALTASGLATKDLLQSLGI